jgi:hypothetical protein
LTPSAPTISRLLAPARISMPMRVRITSTYMNSATSKVTRMMAMR